MLYVAGPIAGFITVGVAGQKSGARVRQLDRSEDWEALIRKAGGSNKLSAADKALFEERQREYATKAIKLAMLLGGLLLVSPGVVGAIDLIVVSDGEAAARKVAAEKAEEEEDRRAWEKGQEEAAKVMAEQEAAAKKAASTKQVLKDPLTRTAEDAEIAVSWYFERDRKLPFLVALAVNGGVHDEYEKVEARGILGGEVNGYWNGRWMPAHIAEVQIAFINRTEGKRPRKCVHLRWLNDPEFEVWREMEASSCERAEKADAEWKQRLSVTRDL